MATVMATLVDAGCHRGARSSGAGATSATIPGGRATLPAPATTAPSATASATAPDTARTTPGEGQDAGAWPFGASTAISRYSCPIVLPGGPFRSFLALADTKVSFVDGDDWLALVNRSPTGALAPSYAPGDLVDLHDLSPRQSWECESAHLCLRREAAIALRHMLDALRLAGTTGRVESAFRAFGTQCWVFGGWAQKARAGFCEATTQSALPGHSQHQLGTTVDMFTSDWAFQGPVFRDGFGCTPGGRWLDENAWRSGFVVSYPIDPDDRKDGSRCTARWDHTVPIDPKTGYKHEPWHLRFIGEGEAAVFHQAWLDSEPGSPGEITLEQWLRARRGLPGDAELPVCDGCACGACATLAVDGDKSPCGDASLRLDPSGRVAAPVEDPRLVDVSAKAAGADALVVELRVHAAAHTPTQTPVTEEPGPTYEAGATFEGLVPYPGTRPHRYPDLPGAWRAAVEPIPAPGMRWPWRGSLAKPELAATWNRGNVVLPALAGDATVRLRIVPPAGTEKLRVTLLRDGAEHDTREVLVPRGNAGSPEGGP
jgi:LAS superfamily LD-carboxypeptidase LdcB